MKQNVTQDMFIDAFKAIRPDNFTYEGLVALYDYLEEQCDYDNYEYELDVIAFCCEFSEYSTAHGVEECYGMTLDEVIDNTLVLCLDNNAYIIQEF